MPVRIVGSREDGQQGSNPNLLTLIRPGFTGTTFGKATTKSDIAIVRGSIGLLDVLPDGTVNKILQIANVINATTEIYTQGQDYKLTGNQVQWLNNPLAPPEIEATVIATGGTVGTGARSVKITALDQSGNESLPSAAIVVVIPTGTTNSIKYSWGRNDFSSGYVIYDITNSKKVTINNQNTTEYIQTIEMVSGGTPPGSNAAYRKPANSAPYYVDYVYPVFNYLPKKYTDLPSAISDHGFGSNLANAASIAFEIFQLSEIYLCATPDDSQTSHQTAIISFDNKEVHYMSACKDSISLGKFITQRATWDSTDLKQRERFAVWCIPSSVTDYGDATTPNTVIYILKSLNNQGRAIIPVTNGNGSATLKDTWQNKDGTVSENFAAPNWWVAVAYACERVALPDQATSATNLLIPGGSYGEQGGPWDDDVVKDQIEAWGGAYIVDDNRSLLIYHDITNNVLTVEDMETSCRAGEDVVRRTIRADLAQYKGKKIRTGRIGAIFGTVHDALVTLTNTAIIEGFNESSLSVKQDPVSKTKVLIYFKYVPQYSITEIDFVYSFDLITNLVA